ncbi:MAG: hypothetical protein KY441_07145, partial [Actinobacteria bacterium]|nr:hypothetical protein [Actinomycetota bacterium]
MAGGTAPAPAARWRRCGVRQAEQQRRLVQLRATGAGGLSPGANYIVAWRSSQPMSTATARGSWRRRWP